MKTVAGRKLAHTRSPRAESGGNTIASAIQLAIVHCRRLASELTFANLVRHTLLRSHRGAKDLSAAFSGCLVARRRLRERVAKRTSGPRTGAPGHSAGLLGAHVRVHTSLRLARLGQRRAIAAVHFALRTARDDRAPYLQKKAQNRTERTPDLC